LSDLEVDAELGEIGDRLADARLRPHRHDVANAVTAVEGAYLLLTQESLQASERSTLTEIMGSGLGRLRELVLVDAPLERARLYELVTSMAEEVGRKKVDVGVAPDLQITGHVDCGSAMGPGTVGRNCVQSARTNRLELFNASTTSGPQAASQPAGPGPRG